MIEPSNRDEGSSCAASHLADIQMGKRCSRSESGDLEIVYWNSGIEEIPEEEMGVEDAQRSERNGRMLEAAEAYLPRP